MTSFLQFCNKLSQLDQLATDDLLDKLYSQSFARGQYLLKVGQVCREFFFIDEGLVKTYFNKEDKEFIMRFFAENSICTQLQSYISQTPSTFKIIALEPTTVTYLQYADFEDLCKKHHSIETLYRKFVSIASVNMMKRVGELLEENATERYNHFVKENNDLLQRISLGDLANYLGITQVSLSRIRAKK
jgi:CRP-like cAMP-binding protein